jgi:hypothetical protein
MRMSSLPISSHITPKETLFLASPGWAGMKVQPMPSYDSNSAGI